MSGIPGEGFDNRQVQIIAVTSTCLVLSTVAVVLRLLVRWSSAAVLWWDDWVAVLALVGLFGNPSLDWSLTTPGVSGDFMAREHLHNNR